MIRIAIIEDDPLIQAALGAAIGASGDCAVVATAATHADGARLVEGGGFDVLVCDLGLPDGDGADLIRRAASRDPDADILVLTMFADHAKVIEAIKAGARGYLLKDQRLDDCVEAIREIRRGGSPISPIIARILLKRFQPAISVAEEEERLSERETETLRLLSRGFTYSECAGIMDISPHTVGTHVKHIYRKLEVRSRSEAVYEATLRGMLDDN